MKTLLTTLAALSLAANVALVALLFAGRSSDTAAKASAATASAAKPASTQPETPAGASWTQLSNEDLPTMVRRLREAGVPIEFIRALAVARLREGFAERRKALRGDTANQSFWKNATLDPRIRAGEMQLYREERAALRELLGAEAEGPETSLYQNKRHESLPPAKVQEVKDLERLFDERRQDIFNGVLGGYTPEQARRLDDIRKEQDAALARVLTPEELMEYQLRNSDAAQQLRHELTAFNATEEEFRSIYKLQSQLEPYRQNMTQDEQQKRFEAQRQVQEQIKTMLGPERGADYERSTNYQYRQTSQLVARLELPADTTNKLWEVKTDTEKRVREFTGDPQARTQHLATLKQEADRRIEALVGTRGVEPYRQYSGDWMRMLTPPAARAPGSSTTTTTIIRTGP